ncbi:hypothetical protein ACFX1T_013272 [Malus domestica]
MAARKLMPYFKSFRFVVMTEFLVGLILHYLDNSTRVKKWAIELGKHGLIYKSKAAIKEQVLADFVAEFTPDGPTPIRASNNEVEYEALLEGLRVAHDLLGKRNHNLLLLPVGGKPGHRKIHCSSSSHGTSIPFEYLKSLTIAKDMLKLVAVVDTRKNLMDQIMAYIQHDTLPNDRHQA